MRMGEFDEQIPINDRKIIYDYFEKATKQLS